MNEPTLVYIDMIPTYERRAFEEKVRQVASALQMNPAHLMQVMKAESKLDPSAENTKFPCYKNGTLDGYATGLIQFIPDTARSLGTTTHILKTLTRIQQMDYVEKYLKPWSGKLKTYYDVYCVVFFPAAIGNSNDDNYVFETKHISRASIARSNPAVNSIDKDDKITMAEFKQYLRNTVDKSLWPTIFGA